MWPGLDPEFVRQLDTIRQMVTLSYQSPTREWPLVFVEDRDELLVFTGKDFRNRRVDDYMEVSVDRMTPGEYLLTIDADMKNRTARRTVRFTVR